MKKKLIIMTSCLFLLTACWNNQEIDDSLFVLGVGLNKEEDKIVMTTESIKPTSTESSGAPQGGGDGGSNVILQKEADTLLNGAREFIRYAKRRLYFAHTRTWILGEELARDDHFMQHLDILRRNEMLRLNSYFFITPHDPLDILNTATLYSDLSSLEIISALDQTEFIAEYTVVKMREFYKQMEGPVHNAYLPIITLKENAGQNITSLEGTAVIKNDKMVGALNIHQTVGLNILLDNVNGGSITVPIQEEEGEKASINIKSTKATMTPTLEGKQLKVNIDTTIRGIVGDNISGHRITRDFTKRIEDKTAQHMKKTMESVITVLQDELKTDIMNLGLETYRKYPEEWNSHLKNNWEDVFANADVNVQVHADISHRGLINDNVDRENQRRPFNNPYHLLPGI
ncbi:Ger(x)C family spore germination protein [Alteribacillus iranensis]|uniref:Germination protein, Ger(X)C family n=1 Tax=Alteribacillus iranensis TaxID=930128 RepID=A0A1I2CYH7_9BACI|nr:Ger(x)C family spore germination protein [Alteribacillus iranensis]SFE73324.1 germination protein, Ger(x)C family [Alteribacillus iranensis]